MPLGPGEMGVDRNLRPVSLSLSKGPGQAGRGKPRHQIIRQVCGDKVDLRSSQEHGSGLGLVRVPRDGHSPGMVWQGCGDGDRTFLKSITVFNCRFLGLSPPRIVSRDSSVSNNFFTDEVSRLMYCSQLLHTIHSNICITLYT